jgi:hypothetical protein
MTAVGMPSTCATPGAAISAGLSLHSCQSCHWSICFWVCLSPSSNAPAARSASSLIRPRSQRFWASSMRLGRTVSGLVSYQRVNFSGSLPSTFRAGWR